METFKVLDYLSDLAAFGTQADGKGITVSSKKKFLKCAKYLSKTLSGFGIRDVETTREGYIYATIPANNGKKSPVIALMAHYDTALENPGNGTKMLIHENYQGGDIKLPKGAVVIAEKELKDKKGHDIVTGSGDNQLGADDKCGVAAILDFARILQSDKSIKHGKIRIIFNNNEEVGRGIEFIDYKKLGADYGYCVDAGDIGNLFLENFNAEAVEISITGVTVHPGYAKDKMINAILVANELIDHLDKKFKSPEQSEAREPYLGLNNISGTWTKVSVHYLLRSFDKKDIKEMQKEIGKVKADLTKKYKGIQIEEKWDEHHRYENAGSILKKYGVVNKIAEKAYKKVGVKVIHERVRGGFDGVKMSFDGLPTTNIFSSSMNMHGLNEWTTRQDMELTVRMLVNLCQIWGEQEI